MNFQHHAASCSFRFPSRDLILIYATEAEFVEFLKPIKLSRFPNSKSNICSSWDETTPCSWSYNSPSSTLKILILIWNLRRRRSLMIHRVKCFWTESVRSTLCNPWGTIRCPCCSNWAKERIWIAGWCESKDDLLWFTGKALKQSVVVYVVFGEWLIALASVDGPTLIDKLWKQIRFEIGMKTCYRVWA